MSNNVSIAAEGARAIINVRGLKQNAVAKKAGYSAKQFNNMLTGRKIITPEDILRIAAALEVTPNELFGITDRKEHDYDTE